MQKIGIVVHYDKEYKPTKVIIIVDDTKTVFTNVESINIKEVYHPGDKNGQIRRS